MELIKISLEAFVVTFLVMIVLEFAGRKSISQFTMIQAVVIIAIGETIFLPITEDNFGIIKTLVIAITLIFFLIFMEWLELKFNFIERLFTKKAVIIVRDGNLNYEAIKKNRMSVDQLELKLRILGISSYEEMKSVTIEANGELGYEFKDMYKPITKFEMLQILNRENELPFEDLKGNNHFDEIDQGHKINHKDKYK
jgi:uncharacterized membrane protein YcaP (DUF421 family)